MEPDHEVDSHTAADATPLPIRVDILAVSAQPPESPEPQSAPQLAQSGSPATPKSPTPPTTAASVLQAIAATTEPWFPARFAVETGIPRDSLDEPLAELRLAGLVLVAEWVRGVGQGYALTPEGEAAAADPDAIARLTQPAPPVLVPQKTLTEPGATVTSNATDATEDAEEPRETELTLNPPLVVPVLLMANVLWFSVCAVWSIRWGLPAARALSESHPEVLHRFGAVTGLDLVNGEWWRLLSACFVHIGALHLIGNMFALAMMGPLAELLWGRWRLLLIYLISGLAGSALAMALRPDALLAGASGAIWGIQMSLFAWLFTFRKHLPPDLASDWFRRLCVVFALNAGISFLPGVSWEGHLGGGVAGFMVAGLLNAARFGDRPRRVSAWILLALLPLLCIAGVAAAMDAKGMPAWQRLRQRLTSEQEAKLFAEKQQKLRDAQIEFNKEAAPLLVQLAPEAIVPTEKAALLLLAVKNRPPERLAALRAKITSLKGVADTIVKSTTREPTGTEAFDRHREQARAVAAARSRSFALLLEMFDTKGPPTASVLETWQTARRDADRLWVELLVK